MLRHGKYTQLIELVKAGVKLAIVVPDETILKLRQEQYPELKDCFKVVKVQGIEITKVVIDEAVSVENCYLDYVEGYLTCTFNHKLGERCLMHDKQP
jgi:hypothetical protein